MEFDFDPAKARSNFRKHGVSFAHAEQALRDELAVTVEDPDASVSSVSSRWAWMRWGAYWWSCIPNAKSRRVLFPLEKHPVANRSNTMRDEYDFSKGKRGAVIASPGKTRITIMLDDDVIEAFRARAESAGTGYQTLINSVLREAISGAKEKQKPLTVATLRRVLREELHAS